MPLDELSLEELKQLRAAHLRQFISIDVEIQRRAPKSLDRTEYRVHTWMCRCGLEFQAYEDRMLHVIEMDNYVDHHNAENPPRKLQCPDCRALFIAAIPPNHAEKCKPILPQYKKGRTTLDLNKFA